MLVWCYDIRHCHDFDGKWIVVLFLPHFYWSVLLIVLHLLLANMKVVGELWRPAGGAYNVDGVLSVMVRGLEDELDARMSGETYASYRNYPLPQFPLDDESAPAQGIPAKEA
jgi:hypothetical protein